MTISVDSHPGTPVKLEAIGLVRILPAGAADLGGQVTREELRAAGAGSWAARCEARDDVSCLLAPGAPPPADPAPADPTGAPPPPRRPAPATFHTADSRGVDSREGGSRDPFALSPLPELGPEWGPEYEVVLPMREAAHREGERVTTLRFGTSG